MTALSVAELRLLDLIQNISNPVFDLIATILNYIAANGEIFIIITALLLIYKPTRKNGLICATALLLDFIILNLLIKPAVGRIRPYDLNPLIDIIVRAPHDFSFPSGHTGVSFAFAAAIAPMGKRAYRAALILAVVMGLSRLYLYVHYPTDVLAGALVGFLCGKAALFLWKKTSDCDKIKGDKSPTKR